MAQAFLDVGDEVDLVPVDIDAWLDAHDTAYLVTRELRPPGADPLGEGGGLHVADQHDDAAALAQLEASATLRAHPQTFTTIGQLRSRSEDWSRALAAFESALELAPDQPDILRLARAAALRTGDEARAAELAERSAAPPSATQGVRDSESTSSERNSSRNAP